MDVGRTGFSCAESSVTVYEDEDSEERPSVSDHSIVTVKDIALDGEGDGVVSSLSENRPELCTKDRATRSRMNDRERLQNDGGNGACSLYAHGTEHTQTELTPADSVQQEEAVTTSSDSTTINVQSVESKQKVWIDEDNSVSVMKKGTCNLVNYDSSDSDESSVTTPRIENLQENNESVFQYPDSNSQTLETKSERDAQESHIANVSSCEQIEINQQIDQEVHDENTTSKVGAEYQGYWNNDGYWVDSNGQLWQADDSYWQWSQQSEQGEWHMYGNEDEKGCDTQMQQGNPKIHHEAQPEHKETTGTESSCNQAQDEFHLNYYQEHSNREQYDSSSQQRYYNHSGYCGQEAYPSNGNQQHTITDHTGDTSTVANESVHSDTYSQSTKHVHHESQAQNKCFEEDHVQYSYHHKSSTDQETYIYPYKQEHRYSSQNPQSHIEHMQSYTHGKQDSNQSYKQQSGYDHTLKNQNQQHQCNEQAAIEYSQQYGSHEYTPQDHGLYEQQQQYALSNTAQHLPPDAQAVASQPSSHNGNWHYSDNRDSSCKYNQSLPQHQGSTGGDSQCWKTPEQYHNSQQAFTGNTNTSMTPSSNVARAASDISHHTIPTPPNHPPPLPPNPPPAIPPPPNPLDHPSQSHMYPNPPTHVHPPLSSHPHPYFSPSPHSSPSTFYSPDSCPPLHPSQQTPHSHPQPSSPIHSQSSYRRHSSPQSYGADRNYSHSSVPQLLRKQPFNHTNNSWQRWKHYRRDISLSPHSHDSTSGVPSSPVNSVSSDVSSTNHDSSTPAHLPGSPELDKTKSPSFSHQLRDPRKFSPPVSQSDSTSKTSKNNNSASSLVRKKTAPLKQSNASPITPSGNNPHLSTVEESSKDTKSKGPTAEPVSFPKSSLSGFKIPKHNKSTETSKTHRKSQVKSITRKVEARVLRMDVEDASAVGGDSKTAKSEQGISVKNRKKDGVDETVEQSTVVKKMEASTVPEAKVEETASISQSSDIDGLSSGDTAKMDLVSLFKTIDSNTLTALASTIQLALDSNRSHQEVKLKVPALSSTKATKLASHDEQQPAVVAKCSDVCIVQEAVDSDPKVQQGTDASSGTDKSIKSITKTGVSSAPRMVIATVLATNPQSSLLPASTCNALHSQREESLTVCIPIKKEDKLHVKFDVQDFESKHAVKEHDTPLEQEKSSNCSTPLQQNSELASIECTVPSEKNVKQLEGHDTSTDSKTELVEVKSPTLSLLRAQDLLFDPKYMYKEYNLRKTRRQESSPEQPSPHKKQKVDKSPTSTVRSNKTKEHSKSTSEKTDKGKRGRASLETKESSNEPPNAKKLKETDSIRSEKQKDVQKHEVSDHQSENRVLDLSVSIPRVQPLSPLQQVTLTQLLTMPKMSQKQSEHISSIPHKLQGDEDKIRNKIGKEVTKVHSSASTILRNRSLGNRPQLDCSLCKRKGGVSSLGFLFGPYFFHPETDPRHESKISRSDEVWLHEDCCVWAPGVCIVGRELQGLKEALSDANKMVCAECKKLGATLFCASRGCKNIYHFPCAVEKGCVLNEDQFQIHCPRHKDTAALLA